MFSRVHFDSPTPKTHTMNEQYPKNCPEYTPGFAYVRTKALLYLKIGSDHYRKDDYFDKPDTSWGRDILELVQSGCEQLANCHGYSQERPMKGLGIDGFYKLIELLHFSRRKVDSSYHDGFVIDKMTLEHAVTGKELILFNLVEMD
jgi:hypothetical protein